MSIDPDTNAARRADDAPSRPKTSPIFVERQTYRRRRLVDAARALPVLGVLLWLLPLLWAVPDTPPRASTGLIYVFVIWCGLPLMAGVLIRAMNRRAPAESADLPEATGHARPKDAP